MAMGSALVYLALYIVAGRDEGVEVEGFDVSHVIAEVVAAILVPFSSQIAGRDRDLGLAFGIRIRGADCGAIRNPVGVGCEEIGDCPDSVSTMGKELLVGQMLFATSARIVKFDTVVVADGGEIVGVEEGAGVGEFGAFVAVLEAATRIADVEVNIELVTWGEWGCQFEDGVEIARAGGYNMERAAEPNV